MFVIMRKTTNILRNIVIIGVGLIILQILMAYTIRSPTPTQVRASSALYLRHHALDPGLVTGARTLNEWKHIGTVDDQGEPVFRPELIQQQTNRLFCVLERLPAHGPATIDYGRDV